MFVLWRKTDTGLEIDLLIYQFLLLPGNAVIRDWGSPLSLQFHVQFNQI